MPMSETLTQDKIAFYQENGYLVLENQIPDELDSSDTYGNQPF